jgi:conjugative relaxase-like TrwC/TraI family protein
MLSISQIKSSSVAASYFEKDDYYAKDSDSPEATGTWFGAGAETLGLQGKVDKDVFKALLDGHLPTGE